MTDEGSIDKYLGVLIKDIDENSFEMSQPFLIRRIMQMQTSGRSTHKSHSTQTLSFLSATIPQLATSAMT